MAIAPDRMAQMHTGQIADMTLNPEEPDWFLGRHYGSDKRPMAFLELYMKGRIDFWPALYLSWSTFDAIPYNRFIKFMKDKTFRTPDVIAGPEDRSFYDALPKMITIWRGQDKLQRVGLSWTTDPDVARDFGTGKRYLNPNPMLLSAKVRKTSVALTLTERGESEVVLFKVPSNIVTHNPPPP